MKRILVTGGAGFVGLALAAELARRPGHELVLVDNLSRGRRDEALEALLALPNVSLVEADLADYAAVARLPRDCDTVYHLAALIGVRHVLARPDEVFRVNLLGILHLLDHYRGAGLRRFVFSSTSEVYAGTLKHYGMAVPTPESTPLALDELDNPRTSYALSKIAGESIAHQHANVHGTPVTVMRYHNVYGPRMGFAHVVPETMAKIAASAEGAAVPVPSPSHTRAFCYIDDAVAATIACAESEACANRTLNIGNPDEEVSIRALVEAVAGAMGRSVAIEELPDTPGSPARRCPDIARLRELAGYAPGTSLREGLRRTWEWYRDRLDQRFE